MKDCLCKIKRKNNEFDSSNVAHFSSIMFTFYLLSLDTPMQRKQSFWSICSSYILPSCYIYQMPVKYDSANGIFLRTLRAEKTKSQIELFWFRHGSLNGIASLSAEYSERRNVLQTIYWKRWKLTKVGVTKHAIVHK